MLLPKPIPNWRQLPRFRSVQAATLLVLLSAVQADWLPLLRPVIPPEYWPVVSGGIGLAIIVVRGLAQKGLAPPVEPPPPGLPNLGADDKVEAGPRG